MSGEYWLGGLGGIRGTELRNSAASDPVEVDRSIRSDLSAPTPSHADPVEVDRAIQSDLIAPAPPRAAPIRLKSIDRSTRTRSPPR